MAYQIAKYTGAQLAKMETQEAARVLDSYVRGLITKAAKKVVRENFATEEEYTTALVRKEEAEKQFYDYLDEQRSLFKSKRLDPDRVYKEAIIPTGETLPNGIEIFKIVPRGFDLEPEETDPESNRIIVRLSERPAMNLRKDEQRGRFNDGGMLVEQSACSVDRSEYLG